MRALLPVAQLLGWFWVFVLPGLLVVAHARAPWRPAVRGLVGASFGMLAMPMLCFCAACLVGTSVEPTLACAVAGAVNVAAGGALLARRRRGVARSFGA